LAQADLDQETESILEQQEIIQQHLDLLLWVAVAGDHYSQADPQLHHLVDLEVEEQDLLLPEAQADLEHQDKDLLVALEQLHPHMVAAVVVDLVQLVEFNPH